MIQQNISHTFTHTLKHKGDFNDVQARLREFHMEVEQGRGAIPINLETPASKRKRWQDTHRGAYVHQSSGGALSDIEVRIWMLFSKRYAFFLHENKCKMTGPTQK